MFPIHVVQRSATTPLHAQLGDETPTRGRIRTIFLDFRILKRDIHTGQDLS